MASVEAAPTPWLVIVNPAAGAGRGGGRWPGLAAALHRQGLSFEAVLTRAPGDAGAAAARAVRERRAVVIAAGGDGTISEVVNGLLHARPRDRPLPALGVLPLGTAQDFARSLGLPLVPEAAVAYLRHARPTPLDVGRTRLGDGAIRYFVTYAGTGFDALVVARAQTWGPRWRGALPYVVGFFHVLRGYANQQFSLWLDGQPLVSQRRINMIIVANGGNYAGLLRMAPGASMRDGWLDVIVIGDVGRLEFLLSVPLALSGRHLAHPKVTALRAREVVITAREPLPVQHDGEVAGPLPAHIDVLPGALPVLLRPD
ncbi:MAG TPA: diacylglycerol kinase family protein [Chloroflexota bacterium]|nr:diacylglycerol kinase family protein [Chloroflexota bacterium]